VIFFVLLWFRDHRQQPGRGRELGYAYTSHHQHVLFLFHTLLTFPTWPRSPRSSRREFTRTRGQLANGLHTGSYVLVFVVAPLLFSNLACVRGAAAAPQLPDLHRPAAGDQGSALGWLGGQAAEARIPLWESFKQTLTNKTFLIYMSSVATFFFGLQLFLAAWRSWQLT